MSPPTSREITYLCFGAMFKQIIFHFLLIYHDTSTILVKRQADFNLSEMRHFLPKLGQHRRYRRENPLVRHICCNIWAILNSASAIDGYKFNINANFLVPFSWVVNVGYKGKRSW